MASDPAKARPPRPRGTTTKSFGTGSRENHPTAAFYSRDLETQAGLGKVRAGEAAQEEASP